jgi:hypothetical protein
MDPTSLGWQMNVLPLKWVTSVVRLFLTVDHLKLHGTVAVMSLDT